VHHKAGPLALEGEKKEGKKRSLCARGKGGLLAPERPRIRFTSPPPPGPPGKKKKKEEACKPEEYPRQDPLELQHFQFVLPLDRSAAFRAQRAGRKREGPVLQVEKKGGKDRLLGTALDERVRISSS